MKMMWHVVCLVMAVLTGGGAMAVIIGGEGSTPNTSTTPGTAKDATNSGGATDPAHPDANDMVSPGGGHDGQDLSGTQASSSQLDKGGMIEDEWDSQIVKFRPWHTPLLSIVRSISRKVSVQNWTIKHMRVGGETLEVTLKKAITGNATSVDINKTDVQGDLRAFFKGKKIYCVGVAGYKRGSQTDREGTLTLIVTDVAKNWSKITVMALNGPAVTAGEVTDELDCRKVPALPLGTVLCAGTVAMSESQLLVTPDNYQPRQREVYLQKKGYNVIYTDDFSKVKKKQPLSVTDIKADALVKYNIGAERDYWMSPKGRWNVQNEDGSTELAYSAEGILNQITNAVAIDGSFTLPLLTTISKLQFTEFSEHNTAHAFCGKNAMEKLLNIELGDKERHIFESLKAFDIDFTRYKTTFGTIDFCWDQTLDMLHLEDCIVVLDLAGAVRYVRGGAQSQTNDLNKGAGEVRNAKRFMFNEADCVALRGFNSIIIGPSDKIYNVKSAANVAQITCADALPTSPTNGQKIALMKDDTAGHKKGVVYMYTVSASGSGSWAKYTGVDDAS